MLGKWHRRGDGAVAFNTSISDRNQTPFSENNKRTPKNKSNKKSKIKVTKSAPIAPSHSPSNPNNTEPSTHLQTNSIISAPSSTGGLQRFIAAYQHVSKEIRNIEKLFDEQYKYFTVNDLTCQTVFVFVNSLFNEKQVVNPFIITNHTANMCNNDHVIHKIEYTCFNKKESEPTTKTAEIYEYKTFPSNRYYPAVGIVGQNARFFGKPEYFGKQRVKYQTAGGKKATKKTFGLKKQKNEKHRRKFSQKRRLSKTGVLQ